MSPKYKERFDAYRLLGSSAIDGNPGDGRLFPEPPDHTIGTLRRDISKETFASFNDQDRLEMKLFRRTLVNIFGVENFSDIYSASQTQEEHTGLYNRFVDQYGTMHGMSDAPFSEKKAKIYHAFESANAMVRFFESAETGMLRHYRTSIGQTNEVTSKNDSIALLRMCFSPFATRKERFEARRKLVLMDTAMRIELATEPMDRNMDTFLDVLNSLGVWSDTTENSPLQPSKKKAPRELVEVITSHSTHDYGCEEVNILQPGEKPELSDYRRYTQFQMRPWTDTKGRKKLVYVDDRTKDDIHYAIKMARKDTRNPHLIDDYVGMKFVFLNKQDIYGFLEMLATKTMVTYDETYDTIANEDKYRVTNQGSSEQLEIVKVHANIAGLKVEFQCHTVRTHMDSRYRDNIGFEEFAVKRLFESGVISLLYPEDIYGIDVHELYENLVSERRRHARIPDYFLPPERRKEGMRLLRYADAELKQDCTEIIDQLQEIPEVLIAVGPNAIRATQEIALRLGINNFYFINDINQLPTNGSVQGKNVLIIDDIGESCTTIKAILKELPDAKAAVLAKRDNILPEDDRIISYWGRVISPETRIVFVEEEAEKNKHIARINAVGLVYTIQNDQILLYVAKRETFEGQYDLKLLGGHKEKEDKDLTTTLIREMREEAGASITPDQCIPLGDKSFSYKQEDQTGLRKGFVRGFGIPIPDASSFVLKPTKEESDVIEYIWVTPQELMERIRWDSYRSAIPKWIEQIAEYEKNKKNT